MQGVAGSIGGDASGDWTDSNTGFKDGDSKNSKTDWRWAEILWRSILINIAVFLPVTRHVVIAGTFMLLNFDGQGRCG
jgi:hypothetical protein